jgi:hypothetical protein
MILRQGHPHEVTVLLGMGQSIGHHSSRAHSQGFQAKAPNSRQRGIHRFKEFLNHQLYRLPIGATVLPLSQRRGTRHRDFQGTLCGQTFLD